MEIKLVSEVKKDRYTDYIESAYDLKVGDFSEVNVPNNLHLDRLGEWNIGVICGASGSGKSTILRSLGDIKEALFENDRPLISNFGDMEPKDAAALLSAMGLASVPAWIRPYRVLSNGEKYRAEMAKVLSEAKEGDIVLVDEYTSVVDRNVAKSMSNALSKYVRKKGIRIVLATCHYDIFDWLQPDWVYDLNKGGVLERGDYLRQGRPQICLQVHRTESDTWDIFKKHHYMTEDLNKSASCFVFTWEGQVVAFVGVLPQPSGYFNNGVRASRIVVLPDFQGLGIGSKVNEFVAAIYKNGGYRYFIKTVNPRLGEYMSGSGSWKASAKNGLQLQPTGGKLNKNEKLRPSYCFEYIGEGIEGYGELIEHIDKVKKRRSLEGQLTLW